MLFSGAWEKVIHEENLKQNISRHSPSGNFHFESSAMKIYWAQQFYGETSHMNVHA